jgi:ATP-binding cassette subfamily B protein
MAGQAFCEMNLPQYTQALIDTGIQNQGIEHILPEAITGSELDGLGADMTAEDEAILRNAYADEPAGEWDNQVIYYRKGDLSEDELDELDERLLEPIARRYAGQIGEELPAEIDTGDRNIQAMGIAYAAECDAEAGMDILGIQRRFMLRCGGMMLLMSIAVMLLTTCVSFLAAKVGADIGRDLRRRLFANVMSFSTAEMNDFKTSSLITRATNDIQQVQMTSTMMLRMMLFAPCICTWSIIKVYQTHAHMNFIIVTGVIAILLLVGTLFNISMPKFKVMQSLVDALNAVSREILTGLQVIRAFGQEDFEEKRFDKANDDLYRNQLFVNRAMISMTPLLMIIMYGITIWITWVSAGRIDRGSLQVGTMTAFIAYAMEIVFSFLMIASMAIFLPRAGIAADRIYEVLETETSIKDADDAEELRIVAKEDDSDGDPSAIANAGDAAIASDATVRFEHVSFKYPDAEENVLTDIDFEARPGETTAIIGSTGSGKSTIINLIPRFFDVSEGRVTIGGRDVRELTMKSLRDAIGYVPQKGILFSGTIEDNIRWGDENATDEEVREAADIAQATEFIEKKPKGFENEVSQGGANVSGGQKQRLAIARAIAKKPEIFIFDDSFSALDMKTDLKLRQALSDKTKDKTRIIVAQRVGTIMHAEQIIVIDEGRIVGKGTHDELMKNCDIYRETAVSQMGEAVI